MCLCVLYDLWLRFVLLTKQPLLPDLQAGFHRRMPAVDSSLALLVVHPLRIFECNYHSFNCPINSPYEQLLNLQGICPQRDRVHVVPTYWDQFLVLVVSRFSETGKIGKKHVLWETHKKQTKNWNKQTHRKSAVQLSVLPPSLLVAPESGRECVSKRQTATFTGVSSQVEILGYYRYSTGRCFLCKYLVQISLLTVSLLRNVFWGFSAFCYPGC